MIRSIGGDARKRRSVLQSKLDDPVAKETMRDIARSYEHLAMLAEAKHAPKTSD